MYDKSVRAAYLLLSQILLKKAFQCHFYPSYIDLYYYGSSFHCLGSIVMFISTPLTVVTMPTHVDNNYQLLTIPMVT